MKGLKLMVLAIKKNMKIVFFVYHIFKKKS